MKLVKVTELLAKLNHTNRTEENVVAWIKKYRINVVHEIPYGRGVMRMMSEDQANEILAQHAPKDPIEDIEEARELISTRECREACQALRTEVAQMKTTIETNSHAVELLIQQSNLLNDQLKRVLKELGVGTPS